MNDSLKSVNDFLDNLKETSGESILVESLKTGINTIYETANESEPPLLEMAKMNVKEVNGSLPVNKYDVRIWSNDHTPPHIHVAYPSRQNPEYEVEFRIDTGDLLKIKVNHNPNETFDTLTKIVKEWLNEKSALQPDKTNRDACIIAWEQNNSEN